MKFIPSKGVIQTTWPPEGGTTTGVEVSAWPRIKGSTPPHDYETRLSRALWMRDHPTPAEALLWKELANNKMGVKFRRQQLIQFYIVDFYCVKLGLVIEIDGSIHDEQIENDKDREQVLLDNGC